MMRWALLLPLIIFIALCGIFAIRLADSTPNSTVPSVFIGKPAPPLKLQEMSGLDVPHLSDASDFGNDIRVINVWASYCGPCQAEHAQIEALAKMPGVTVAGINYKDEPENAARFLSVLGNPFDLIGADPDGSISLTYGVYGLPETFIIDQHGIIREKYVGAITADMLEREVKPLILNLQAAR